MVQFDIEVNFYFKNIKNTKIFTYLWFIIKLFNGVQYLKKLTERKE